MTGTSNNHQSEASPLIQPHSSTHKPYYFLAGRKDSIAGDETSLMERLPVGTTGEEFASRPVTMTRRSPKQNPETKNPNFFTKLFGIGSGGGGNTRRRRQQPSPQVLKSDKAAIKIEPKVFFSNERTFLAWLHTSVLLAGASIAITSFSEGDLLNQLYAIILLPVAITFLCYAMHQYGKRAKMIRATAPGPYEDVIGPCILAVVLICAIIIQFSIKFYSILYT